MTNIKGKVPCCRRRQIAVEKASTMKILILNHTEVEQLLPMAECIEVMAEALADLSAGRMHQPLRSIVRPPDAIGLMGLMPSYRAGAHALYGLKAVCVFPGNTALGKDAHQGSVMLFSADTGELVALMNASAITTAAVVNGMLMPTRLRARPAIPARPNARSSPTPATVGGSTMGSAMIASSTRLPRNSRVASR